MFLILQTIVEKVQIKGKLRINHIRINRVRPVCRILSAVLVQILELNLWSMLWFETN